MRVRRCDLLHNVVMGSLQVIKNMSHTGEHASAGRIQRALDRYGKCNSLYTYPLIVLKQVSVPQGMYGDLKSSYCRKGSQSCLYWVGLLLACFPILFPFITWNSFQWMCVVGAVATIVAVSIINMSLSAIRSFSKTVGDVIPAPIHTPYTEPQLVLFLY